MVIDDSAAACAQITQVLQHALPAVACVPVTGRVDFESALAAGNCDLVLTEYQLTWSDGLTLLHDIKARLPYVPVVMVTAAGHERLAVEGIHAGLSDYVPKTQLAQLPAIVLTCLERTRQVLRRQQEAAAVESWARQQAAVAALGQQALGDIELSTLLDTAVSMAASILDVEYAKVLELLPDGQTLLLRAGVGWHAGLVGTATVDADIAHQAGYTLFSDTPVVVDDLRTETRFSGPQVLHDHGVISGMSVIIRRTPSTVPLAGPPQPARSFGVLGVHAPRHRLFTTHDMHFLQAVANILAQAIERRRITEALAAETRFLRAQTAVARVALSSLQPEILMPQLLEAICQAQDYAYGLFWCLVEPDRTAVVVASFGQETTTLVGYQQPLQAANAFIVETLRTGKPLFRNQIAETTVDTHPLTSTLRSKALLGLPLVDRLGRTIGALSFGDTKNADRFAERDLQQGVILMHQVAQALENSELFSQVRRLQEQYHVVTEHLHDAVCMIDQAGQIVFANAALSHLTGYDKTELLGKPSIMLYRPEVIPQILERRAQAWQGQDVPPYLQTQMLRKDGQHLAVEMSLATLTLDGQIVGRVAVARDMTPRLQLEAQLRQAQKMQAIGTLAGGIAHDFNNILTAILGYTELTLDEVPEETTAWTNLQHVLTASERAKALVQQMLTFSRQTEQPRHPTQLQPLVQEALILLRAALPTSVTLEHQMDATVGPVLADPTQIHQILMNLCSNAEYMLRNTGGSLHLLLDEVPLPPELRGSRPDLPSGMYARLAVRDTGPGMPPEVQERIFEPFFTTKEIGEGTGLGLAVVHGIVTSHGGAISVESAPGQGTTFRVYLPRCAEPATTLAPMQERAPSGSERILLVDDEAPLARLLHIRLTHLGYQVVMCTSSAEALEVFQKAPRQFDLVITDQTMPQMTGEGLARALRRLRPDLPIILCTGFSHVMTPERAQRLGIDAFCMKPIKIQELGLIIRQVLARRAAQRA